MTDLTSREAITAIIAGATIAAAVLIVRKDLKDTDDPED